MSLASSSSTFLKGVAKGAGALNKNDGVGTPKRAAAMVARAGGDDASEAECGSNDQQLAQKLVSGVAAASVLANVAVVPVALAAEAIAEVYQSAAVDLPADIRQEFPKFDEAVPLSGPMPLADVSELTVDSLYQATKKSSTRDEIIARAAEPVPAVERAAQEWRYRAPDAPRPSSGGRAR